VPEQDDAQTRLRTIMDFACRRARLLAPAKQDRGDGQLVIPLPGVNEARAVPGLVTGLVHALHEANSRWGAFGRIRLRAALTQGAIAKGATGYEGPAVVSACRMVDCELLRHELRLAAGSDLALLVADDLHRDVVAQGFAGLSGDDLRRVSVQAKGSFHAIAWLYLPPSGPVPAPGTRKTPIRTALTQAPLTRTGVDLGIGAVIAVATTPRSPRGEDHQAGHGSIHIGNASDAFDSTTRQEVTGHASSHSAPNTSFPESRTNSSQLSDVTLGDVAHTIDAADHLTTEDQADHSELVDYLYDGLADHTPELDLGDDHEHGHDDPGYEYDDFWAHDHDVAAHDDPLPWEEQDGPAWENHLDDR
jgi:hypothetical protein